MTARSTLSLQIEVIQAGETVQVVQADQPLVQIGQLPSCAVRVQDPAVARVHAMIENQGTQGVFLVDLGSMHGTWKDDQPVDRVPLQHGDSFRVGSTTLRVQFLEAAEPVEIPTSTATSYASWSSGSTQSHIPAEAVEVKSFFDGTILDRQVVDRKTKGLPKMWGWLFLGLGALCLLGFGISLSTAHGQIEKAAIEFLSLQKLDPTRHIQADTFLAQRISLPILFCVPLFGFVALLSFVTAAVILGRRTSRSEYTIGLDPRVDFSSPEPLPMSVFPLVRGASGHFEVLVTQSMQCSILLDKTMYSLPQAIAAGLAQSTVLPHVYAIPVYQASTIGVVLGPNRFLIKSAGRLDRPFPIPLLVAWGALVAIFSSLGLMVLLYLMIPRRFESGVYIDPKKLREIASITEQIQSEEPPPPPGGGSGKGSDSGAKGPEGQRAKGPEGKMGEPKSPNQNGKTGLKGNDPVPKWTSEQRGQAAKAAASEALSDVLGGNVLASNGGLFIGPGPSTGGDRLSGVGPSTDGEIGDGHGASGRGLSGTGTGGGGTGDGTYGLGNLATAGRGGGGTGGGRYGHGGGTGGLKRGAGTPEVVPATPEVRGSLDKELIRRVIRRHINEVKFCYEKELIRHPGMGGRVIVQFTIAPTGAVANAEVQSSTLNNSTVESCMAQAVRRWEFPKPQKGVVGVSYPFVLKQTGGDSE